MGDDEQVAHIEDFHQIEADRANEWWNNLDRGIDEMGTMIYCTCGEWTFPKMGRDFAHKHWESCGKKSYVQS